MWIVVSTKFHLNIFFKFHHKINNQILDSQPFPISLILLVHCPSTSLLVSCLIGLLTNQSRGGLLLTHLIAFLSNYFGQISDYLDHSYHTRAIYVIHPAQSMSEKKNLKMSAIASKNLSSLFKTEFCLLHKAFS